MNIHRSSSIGDLPQFLAAALIAHVGRLLTVGLIAFCIPDQAVAQEEEAEGWSTPETALVLPRSEVGNFVNSGVNLAVDEFGKRHWVLQTDTGWTEYPRTTSVKVVDETGNIVTLATENLTEIYAGFIVGTPLIASSYDASSLVLSFLESEPGPMGSTGTLKTSDFKDGQWSTPSDDNGPVAGWRRMVRG